MITFTKNYDLGNIKNKLIILYILNVTDIIFTLMLLNTGIFIEANIFMRKVVGSVPISLILKIILPGLLLMFIYFRIQKATEHQLKKSNFLISGAVAFYGLINLLHVVWTVASLISC